ncbi:MAG: PaaI family thioesterase [Notoacmeibacter sp.]|nr:PaaI family thioesterase [Notoacmeibacter sp.]
MRDYSDPEAERRLRAVAHTQGFANWLGFDIVAVGNGRAELSLDVRPDLLQHHGFVHGGIIATLADVASAWCAASVAGDVVTSSFNMHYVAPAKGQRLIVRASVIKAGRRQASVEAKVWIDTAGEERLCGASMASIAILGAAVEAA